MKLTNWIFKLGSIIAMTLLMTGTANAQAGFFLEPGISYELGESSIDYPSPFNSSSGDVKGLGALGRAGLHVNESFFLALDGRYSRPNWKDSTNNLESEAEAYQLAPVAGLQMPDYGLRLWGGYVLASQMNPAEANGVDLKFKDGKGFLVGAGPRVSMVSLNLEYQKLSYDSTELEKAGPFSGNFDSIKFKNDAWIASVTFPLEF